MKIKYMYISLAYNNTDTKVCFTDVQSAAKSSSTDPPVYNINLLRFIKHMHNSPNGRVKGIYARKDNRQQKFPHNIVGLEVIQERKIDQESKESEPTDPILRMSFKKDIAEKVKLLSTASPRKYKMDSPSKFTKGLVEMKERTVLTKEEVDQMVGKMKLNYDIREF